MRCCSVEGEPGKVGVHLPQLKSSHHGIGDKILSDQDSRAARDKTGRSKNVWRMSFWGSMSF